MHIEEVALALIWSVFIVLMNHFAFVWRQRAQARHALDAYLRHIWMVREVRREKSSVLHPEHLYAIELFGRERLIAVGGDVERAVHRMNTALADMAAFRAQSVSMAGPTAPVAAQRRKQLRSLLTHPTATTAARVI